MNILTSDQMRELDRKTIEETGIPGIILMENAGIQLFNYLNNEFDEIEDKKITIICGKGNNGGDGMVLARQLAMRGNFPEVVLLARADDIGGDAGMNLQILANMDIPLIEVTTEEEWLELLGEIDDSDIVVDAMLGTGIDKDLKGLYAEVARGLNSLGAFILSVDIPSGMFSDRVQASPLAVEADATVTFTAPKIAHILNRNLSAVGRLSVVPIGTPDELMLELEAAGSAPRLLTEDVLASLLVPRPDASYKGSYGHVVIAAGSRGKSGAAVLSSEAALKAGCGLVTALVPEGIQDRVAVHLPEIMTEGMPETDTGSLAFESADPALLFTVNRDSAAIGPGLTTNPETVEVVYELVRRLSIPAVIDADGLNAIASNLDLLQERDHPPLVLTPHPGEFSRLSGLDREIIMRNPIQTAADFAQRYGIWLVLKDFRVIVASPDGSVTVSPFGNPGMATAGMGDVLTGILASTLGQYAASGMLEGQGGITEAICLGVGIHGLAGDLASLEVGFESLTAGDVIDSLQDAFSYLEEI